MDIEENVLENLESLLIVPPETRSPKTRSRGSSNVSSAGNSSSEDLYKTELCHAFQSSGSCKYGAKCRFAHGAPELRPVARHPKYKTQHCKTFRETGHCPYGSRCKFIHDEGAVQPPKGDMPDVPLGALVSPRMGSLSAAPTSPTFHTFVNQQGQYVVYDPNYSSSSQGNSRSNSMPGSEDVSPRTPGRIGSQTQSPRTPGRVASPQMSPFDGLSPRSPEVKHRFSISGLLGKRVTKTPVERRRRISEGEVHMNSKDFIRRMSEGDTMAANMANLAYVPPPTNQPSTSMERLPVFQGLINVEKEKEKEKEKEIEKKKERRKGSRKGSGNSNNVKP